MYIKNSKLKSFQLYSLIQAITFLKAFSTIPFPQQFSLKGVAYYFTPSGNQIWKMPGYQAVGGKKNYDDSPEVDGAYTKTTLEYNMENLDTDYYGSVQYMVIVMVSISSLKGKAERSHFLHCSITNWKHPNNCSMTTPVNYMSIA